MAATRLIALHVNKGKTVAQCLADRTDYSQNASKTNDGEFISSYECDPVMLIKIPFIQYLYGIKSMRQTMKEIEVNIAYRWFLGLDMLDPVPHFSTFGKNYTRRFKDTDLFEQIFSKILEKRGWNTASFYWLF